jgi:hypothetical protein
MTAVNRAPTAIPRTGFSIPAMAPRKGGQVRSGFMASPMIPIPRNTSPSAMTAVP